MSNALGEVCSVFALACLEVISGFCYDFTSIRNSCTQCVCPYSRPCLCCPHNCCQCGEDNPVGPVHLPDESGAEERPAIRSAQPKRHLSPESTVAPAATGLRAT